jgi:DNA-directed RNA polymerase specialized sigma24 family protein
MAGSRSPDATQTLIAHTRGDARATERLSALLYDELRRIARRLLRRERPGHTLQPTALVNEAYLRLIQLRQIDWESRTHFRNMAARVMRRVTLDEDLTHGADRAIEMLELDRAIERLRGINERSSKVSELRVFGGMSNAEIAHVLGVSERTVVDDWQFARAWLARELSSTAGGAPCA